MNKTEFVSAFAEAASISKAEANRLVKTYNDLMVNTLAKGEEIKMTGFGTFKLSEVSEKEVINPRTKEKMIVPSYPRVRFKAGQELKDTLKRGQK